MNKPSLQTKMKRINQLNSHLKKEKVQLSGDSLTKQSFKKECDINNIVKRADSCGVLRGNVVAQPREGRFDDFSSGHDFHSMLNRVHEANQAFMELPAKIRHRFQNNPEKLIDFLCDGRNRKEALELGLLTPTDKELFEMQVEARKKAEENSKKPAETPEKTPEKPEKQED